MSQDVYRTLYFEQIAKLDPMATWEKLHDLSGGVEPILLCYERVKDIAAGTTYCHRHMAAEWFKTTLNFDVPEIGSGHE